MRIPETPDERRAIAALATAGRKKDEAAAAAARRALQAARVVALRAEADRLELALRQKDGVR